MNFLIEIDPLKQPDAVGEYLRSEFFAAPDRLMGCCESFDWQADVHPLPPLPLAEHSHPTGVLLEDGDICPGCDLEGLFWTRGEKLFPKTLDRTPIILPEWTEIVDDEVIECRWWWEGDGTLAFHLPDGQWLVNDDCKKRHGWTVQNSLDQ